MAISAVPDLDQDGYNDVVVGAPLEDAQKGVIYIYNGDKKTLKKQFSQVRREMFVLNDWLTKKIVMKVFCFSTLFEFGAKSVCIFLYKFTVYHWVN